MSGHHPGRQVTTPRPLANIQYPCTAGWTGDGHRQGWNLRTRQPIFYFRRTTDLQRHLKYPVIQLSLFYKYSYWCTYLFSFYCHNIFRVIVIISLLFCHNHMHPRKNTNIVFLSWSPSLEVAGVEGGGRHFHHSNLTSSLYSNLWKAPGDRECHHGLQLLVGISQDQWQHQQEGGEMRWRVGCHSTIYINLNTLTCIACLVEVVCAYVCVLVSVLWPKRSQDTQQHLPACGVTG